MVILCLPEIVWIYYMAWTNSKPSYVEYDSYVIDEDLYNELVYSESYGHYEVCD